MEIDLTGEHKGAAYKILASLVTPRPIAWVTTNDIQGRINAAPFSFFNVFGTQPPVVVIAPGDKDPGVPKDTARNIRDTGEFVINLVDETVFESMVASAATLPHGVEELADSGLSLRRESSSRSAPHRRGAGFARMPRAQHPAHWSEPPHRRGGPACPCPRGHLRSEDPAHGHVSQYQPLGRMASPDWYTRTTDLFEFERPD